MFEWARLFRRPERLKKTLEEEAWLMRAEERTNENERRLMNLLLNMETSVIGRTIDKARNQE